MDKKQTQVLKKFKMELTSSFPDAKVLLFGSRARKEALKTSDYDIIIISKDFKGEKMPRRFEKVYEHWDFKEHADLIPYTPEEFEEFSQRLTIARKAKQEGIYI